MEIMETWRSKNASSRRIRRQESRSSEKCSGSELAPTENWKVKDFVLIPMKINYIKTKNISQNIRSGNYPLAWSLFQPQEGANLGHNWNFHDPPPSPQKLKEGPVFLLLWGEGHREGSGNGLILGRNHFRWNGLSGKSPLTSDPSLWNFLFLDHTFYFSFLLVSLFFVFRLVLSKSTLMNIFPSSPFHVNIVCLQD